jgi:predicted phosphodiesterase
MRIALLSDIHGNAFALEAVLADIRNRVVDLLVNLGDIFYGPVAPEATFELLMEHDMVTIRGNQDRQLLEAATTDIPTNPTLEFVLDDLDDAAFDWLASLSPNLQLTPELFLCHGAPDDDMTYLLEAIHTGHPQLRPDAHILERLNGEASPVIACGHTHLPRTVTLSTGQLVINPGSVGLPAYTDDRPYPHAMENFSPHAAYGIIEKTRSGWSVFQVRVPYDVQRAAEAAARRNRPDWVHFLTTGRA